MKKNVETAQKIIVETIGNLPSDFPNSQEDALKFSIITEKSKIPDSILKKLDLLLGRYI